MKRYSNLISIIAITLMVVNCGPDFEIIEDLKYNDYQLLNIDSTRVEFPDLISGDIGIVGYIFTNCPDICPLTTNNMRLVQEQLKADNITGVQFVSISFDPDVDKPKVLKEFAQIRNLDLSNWDFLTGEKSTIDMLLKKVGVVAFVGDSTVFEDGSKSYYYTHTDRIQLIDQDGRIRKNYLGSAANIDEIVNDVRRLLD
ncbi:MAG: SCO family protein [Melioribacteraceae bacterium]|nr:SCO family protein [Melioribacteraceae bacterium]